MCNICLHNGLKWTYQIRRSAKAAPAIAIPTSLWCGESWRHSSSSTRCVTISSTILVRHISHSTWDVAFRYVNNIRWAFSLPTRSCVNEKRHQLLLLATSLWCGASLRHSSSSVRCAFPFDSVSSSDIAFVLQLTCKGCKESAH